VARAQGQDAGRVSFKRLTEDANAIFQRAYGRRGENGRWVEATAENWLYLNYRLLAQRGVKAADAEATLASGLKNHPGVLATYTRTQLAGGDPVDDPLGRAVWRSFHPDRSGDVAVVLKPYYIPGEDLVGTTHGSPHPYDTHVPLLVYGLNIRAGPRVEAVTPEVVAGILAAGLSVTPPAGTEARLPDIFEPKP
jgi:hypothetical protein